MRQDGNCNRCNKHEERNLRVSWGGAPKLANTTAWKDGGLRNLWTSEKYLAPNMQVPV